MCSSSAAWASHARLSLDEHAVRVSMFAEVEFGMTQKCLNHANIDILLEVGNPR
jgi:hypothetical protein